MVGDAHPTCYLPLAHHQGEKGKLQGRPMEMSNVKIQMTNGGCAARGH
jgi:hypothetical protein